MVEHGRFTADPCRAMTILSEEVGEAAAEILCIDRAVRVGDTRAEHEARQAAIEELIQIVAVCVMFIISLNPDRRLLGDE